jgi:transcriptional regulator with XRE-family HTH domain
MDMEMKDKIQKAMFDKRLTQTDLAKILNVSPQAVQQWLTGKTMPKGKRLLALATALNVSQIWLLGDDRKNSIKEDAVEYTVNCDGLSKDAIEFAKAWQELCPEQRAVLTATAKAFIHSAGKQKDKAG